MSTSLFFHLDDFEVRVGNFEMGSHLVESLESDGLDSEGSFTLGEMQP